MASSHSASSAIPPTPLLPKLAFSSSSFDLSSDTDESTPNSETTTLTDRHDSLKDSPRSSLCSSRSTESKHHKQHQPSHKRVRFEESVCWSYFDVEQHIPTVAPTLDRKPSFLGRSWARFKSRNSSGDLDISTSALELRDLSRANLSVDALSRVAASPCGRPILTRRSLSSPSAPGYTIQQPLRESAGRRYDAAATHAIWRASAAKAKGDWGDLLSNPRSSRLYA